MGRALFHLQRQPGCRQPLCWQKHGSNVTDTREQLVWQSWGRPLENAWGTMEHGKGLNVWVTVLCFCPHVTANPKAATCRGRNLPFLFGTLEKVPPAHPQPLPAASFWGIPSKSHAGPSRALCAWEWAKPACVPRVLGVGAFSKQAPRSLLIMQWGVGLLSHPGML